MKKTNISFIMIIIVVFFAVIGSGFYYITSLSNIVREESQNYLREVSLQSANAMRNKIESDFQIVKSIAAAVNGKDKMEFFRMAGFFKNFQRVAVVYPDGKPYIGDAIEGIDFIDREYFKKAVSGTPYISDRIKDKVTGESCIVYAVPITEHDNVVAVVVALVYEKTYRDILGEGAFGGKAYAYVVNHDGQAVISSSHNDSDSTLKNIFNVIEAPSQAITLMQQNMMAGASGVMVYEARAKVRVLIYTPLHIKDWYMISVIPYQVIAEKTQRFTLLVIAESLIVMAVMIVLILYMLRMQRRSKEALCKLAFYDELTGARNLNKFKADAVVLLAKNSDMQYAIAKIDIDKFKYLNELFGFGTGDLVLQNVSKAIGEVIDNVTDIYARIASDEFLVLMVHYGDEDRERKRLNFENAFYRLMGKSFKYKVTFPTGRYVLEQNETNMPQILEKVNMAHRLAKQEHNVPFIDYNDAVKRDALRNQDIENKMEHALRGGEFQMYLQPKYLLMNEKMVGAEALVRWKTKSGEMIFPNTFIPIFEKNGFITKLDFYMFEKACQMIRKWMDIGLHPMSISVNFSRLHLNSPGFVGELCRIADMYAVHRMYLEVELTETTLFDHGAVIVDFFTEVHKAGFTVSMDDFGTGYSSLGMLKNLPVDVVKIDRSFFVDAIDEERVKAVMSCIIDMTKRLGIHTVAEGVETKEHIALLRELGCDIVQGYYFSRPMPANELTEKMKKES